MPRLINKSLNYFRAIIILIVLIDVVTSRKRFYPMPNSYRYDPFGYDWQYRMRKLSKVLRERNVPVSYYSNGGFYHEPNIKSQERMPKTFLNKISKNDAFHSLKGIGKWINTAIEKIVTGRGYRNDDIPESRTLSRRIGGRTHRVSKKRASRQFVTSANAIPLLIVPAIYATLNLFEDELTELSRPVIDVLNCDGNISAPNYDLETGVCKCGTSPNRLVIACSNSTPFCIDGSCRCSQSFDSYVKGVSVKGTCQGTEMCLDDGACVDVTVISDCNVKSGNSFLTNITLNKHQRTIYTPNYPEDYEIKQICTWILQVPPGRRLKLEKFSYIIEDDVSCVGNCCYDYVSIHDGRNENEDKLVILCGKGEQGNIVSTGNNLFLKFESDKAITKPGFQIHYDILST